MWEVGRGDGGLIENYSEIFVLLWLGFELGDFLGCILNLNKDYFLYDR